MDKERRHLSRHRCQNARQAKRFRIGLRQDETETSLKCLRHETIHGQQNVRRAELRGDWDDFKMFKSN